MRQDIVVNQPVTQEQRNDVAGRACSYLKLDLPAIVDSMDNRVGKAYEAWPDRLYVVGKDGRIAYAGAPGPFGFDVAELKDFLKDFFSKK